MNRVDGPVQGPGYLPRANHAIVRMQKGICFRCPPHAPRTSPFPGQQENFQRPLCNAWPCPAETSSYLPCRCRLECRPKVFVLFLSPAPVRPPRYGDCRFRARAGPITEGPTNRELFAIVDHNSSKPIVGGFIKESGRPPKVRVFRWKLCGEMKPGRHLDT